MGDAPEGAVPVACVGQQEDVDVAVGRGSSSELAQRQAARVSRAYDSCSSRGLSNHGHTVVVKCLVSVVERDLQKMTRGGVVRRSRSVERP